MTELECADMGDVNDSAGGSLQAIGARVTHTNKVVEVHRYRSFEPPSSFLVVPEDVSAFAEHLIAGDCQTAVQRRLCSDSCCGWEVIEHYSGVQLSSIQKASLTASGIGATDSVPSVTVPFIFSKRTLITAEPPTMIDDGGSDKFIDGSTLAIAYCDCQSCCTGATGCGTIFRLTTGGALEYSTDNALSWLPTPSCQMWDRPFDLACVNGRLFILAENGLFYANDPLGEWSQASTPFGTLNRMSSSGTVLYGIYSDSGGRSGVARSITGGAEWEETSVLTRLKISEISAAGSYVAAVGEKNKLHYSTDRGITWQTVSPNLPGTAVPTLVAIGLAKRVDANPDCVVGFLADQANNVYKGEIGGDSWSRIYEGSQHGASSAVGSRAYLDVSLNGHMLWWAREVGGKSVAMKNAGDCTCWKRFEADISTGMCEEDSIPPDTYVLGCVIDGVVQSILRCESQEIPCGDGFDYVYGCTVGDTTYVLRCDDGCEDVYVAPENDCATCTCSSCGSDCQECSCDGDCDGCMDCGVAASTVDEAKLQELIDQLNCAAGCEALALDDFGYQIDCGQVALVGIGCIDPGGVDVYEVGCGVSVSFAVCPHDKNRAVIIGSEGLQHG